MGLVYNLVAGGDSLSDLEVLRGDPGTRQLIELDEIIAPATAGSACLPEWQRKCVLIAGFIVAGWSTSVKSAR